MKSLAAEQPRRESRFCNFMIPTRFAVAVHILLLIATRAAGEKSTSGSIAECVHTHPVVVRRIVGRLSRAGLVTVRRGPGGAALTRPPAEITLGDVWRAMKEGADRELLPLHDAARHCLLGKQIGEAFSLAEIAMERALGQTTLDRLVSRRFQGATDAVPTTASVATN